MKYAVLSSHSQYQGTKCINFIICYSIREANLEKYFQGKDLLPLFSIEMKKNIDFFAFEFEHFLDEIHYGEMKALTVLTCAKRKQIKKKV